MTGYEQRAAGGGVTVAKTSDYKPEITYPIIRWAEFRKEIQDKLDSGGGHGLFSPIFVDLYDALLADRATIDDLRATVTRLENELAETTLELMIRGVNLDYFVNDGKYDKRYKQLTGKSFLYE